MQLFLDRYFFLSHIPYLLKFSTDIYIMLHLSLSLYYYLCKYVSIAAAKNTSSLFIT